MEISGLLSMLPSSRLWLRLRILLLDQVTKVWLHHRAASQEKDEIVAPLRLVLGRQKRALIIPHPPSTVTLARHAGQACLLHVAAQQSVED